MINPESLEKKEGEQDETPEQKAISEELKKLANDSMAMPPRKGTPERPRHRHEIEAVKRFRRQNS